VKHKNPVSNNTSARVSPIPSRARRWRIDYENVVVLTVRPHPHCQVFHNVLKEFFMTLQVSRGAHLWRIPWHHQVSSAAAAAAAVITCRRTDEKRLSRRGGRKNEPYLRKHSENIIAIYILFAVCTKIWKRKDRKNSVRLLCVQRRLRFSSLRTFPAPDAIDTCTIKSLKTKKNSVLISKTV